MMVMRSRYVFLALPMLALSAAPSAAQDVVFVSGTGETEAIEAIDNDFAPAADDTDTDFAGMADKIANPAVQDGVAAAIESATGAMMNLPIGRFADAIERARPGTVSRRVRGDATVADIAGRDARYLPEELGTRSREAMGMMSGFARAMAVMMPEFERVGREMEESFRAAKAEARRNRN
jgi:hypothetical protein